MNRKLSTTKRALSILIFVIYLLLTSSLLAQNKFLLNLDTAQFQDSENQSYLEIYYSIPEVAVQYVGDIKGNYTCEILASLRIYQTDSLWASKLWKIERSISDTSELALKQIVDLLRYPIDKSGKYKIVLNARDLNRPDLEDSVEVNLDLKVPSQDVIGLSDLELASNIQKVADDSQSKFTRYTYEVLPNPTSLYGEGAPELYYYYEAYNLLKNVPGNKYKTLCKIKEYKENITENLVKPYRTKMKRYDRSIEFGKIDVSDLHSGIYIITYGICDSAENLLISKQKEFYIHNPSIEITASAGDTNLTTHSETDLGFLVGMSVEELDTEFDKMYYLTNKNQKKLYKNLSDLGAKRKFIYSIWKSSKTDPTTTLVYFRQKYLERIKLADKRFHSVFKPGWKTDQGRIFILYGSPSNIERHASTTSTKPYEIWQYEHLEGGVYFVFIDRLGLKKYELIHSTLRGELQEPNWERYISTTIEMY